MPASASSIAVLGAGITGLTAAHRLTRLGHRVRLFESADRAGGAIRTERTDGWLIESGPNSLLGGEPALEALLGELGLAGARVAADPAAKNRYIVRDGAPVAAPLSPPALLKSPLFSPLGKLRALADLFSRPRRRTTDVSLAAFVGAHFGAEFVDYALDPFVNGVYAGDPARLSARHAFPKLWEMEQKHGSILRGSMAAAKARRARGEKSGGIFSFRDGLQTLTDALAAALPAETLALGVTLDTLIPVGPPGVRQWSVVWHCAGGQTETETFDRVVLALPAPALARLRIGPLGERPLAALDAMEHPPVSSLFLGFHRDQVTHPLDGFGMLVPAAEQRPLLGVLFSSTLFPGRAPADHVALTVMVGGRRAPALARLTTDELLAVVRPDLKALLGVTGAPLFVRHTFWPRAIPQYEIGHEQFLAAMSACERAHPGLFLGGQARDGIAVPACLAAGENLARRAAGTA